MATYKQPCIHCGSLIDREAIRCPKCASRMPFGCNCPYCLKSIERSDMVCSGCGRALTIFCPYCQRPTFIGSDRCEVCGQSLLVTCNNKRCGELQFYLIEKCTVCGKKIKAKLTKL